MRRAIIAIGLVVITGAAWFALAPSSNQLVSMGSESAGSVSLELPPSGTLREPARPEEPSDDGTATLAPSDIDADADADLASESASAAFSSLLDREIERIKSEPVDVEWATETAQLLRSEAEAYLSAHPELQERYSIAGVDCRTSACELTFYDFSPDLSPSRSDLMSMMRSAYADTWFESFEEGWFGRSTIENGLYEYRQYLTRRTTPVDLESVQKFRIPVIPAKAPEE